MKTLLLTGFEPFLNFSENPTMTIVENLNEIELAGYKVVGKILPVDYEKSGDAIIKLIEELKPDAVVSLGLAGGRNQLTPERIAMNCNESDQPDNAGNTPRGERIHTDGPDGIFSTLPIQQMVDRLHEAGYPAKISNSAGTYLCNHVMYRALYYFQQNNQQVPTGFIHIPASHQLAVEHGRIPSWSQVDLQEAVKLCLACMK
ncbi:pyroglutamyl-peptidase I [Allobacillus sp. GCM10007491]|uniref:Pyroglutamyl-peptidase I n=1 Tax=Allobacillus saliphilus TaxID=2912308 RepID=A0A941HRH8_9BACI|nr:pyroglutamyl-peptidase I [Allobacillus saliphilus]MBR7552611.1 pyroglutamyl-peptidase I [Allobacillus saliphilus]